MPIWLKLAYSVLVALVVAVYWRAYGPSNFLWFSDVALIVTAIALWRESALLASMMAVGVLPFEIAWSLDFVTGGRALGLARYMLDARLPVFLRALSLFHLVVPVVLLWMLSRLGYDPRALIAQIVLATLVLLVSWLVAEPERNVNWVLGPGEPPARVLPPYRWLVLLIVLPPLVVYLPMHLLLLKLFGRP
jgi:hypothetical protein